MKIIILGCGSSTGVPEIGCQCKVCTSEDPRNIRSRVSVLIEVDGKNILIDSSPDLRLQSLRNGISHLDAVLYTHDHADHTSGLDDLRAFNKIADRSLDIYSDAKTIDTIGKRFEYALKPKTENIWFRPSLTPHIIPDEKTHDFIVQGIKIKSFQQIHGRVTTLGYRIGNFAYSTDCNEMPETALEALQGTEIWVVDCLRYSESYTHSNLKLTLSWIDRVKPKMAILTHMAHDFDYSALSQELPAGVYPAYDGMVLQL